MGTVHPRACGERRSVRDRRGADCGSSPRLRGTRRDRADELVWCRFIPAPAGNARSACSIRGRSPVHPRACGERPYPTPVRGAATGSSPRLRGTRSSSHLVRAWPRFIPAPAGNAPRSARSPTSCTVHPRACGERLVIMEPKAWNIGSSPRLRGTRFSCLRTHEQIRFIPAPAGNAPLLPACEHPAPVHPRACGERSSPWRVAPIENGSSPRLRGTPFARGPRETLRRFIPAPAGNAPA